MSVRGFRSLRSRFLFVVFVGVLLPFALVNAWLRGSAAHSAQAHLGNRLDAIIDQVARETGDRWAAVQSALLATAVDPEVLAALHATPGELSIPVPIPIPASFDSALVGSLTVSARRDSIVMDVNELTPAHVAMSAAVRGENGREIGTLTAQVSLEHLVPREVGEADVRVYATDSEVPPAGMFEVGGAEWLGRQRSLATPGVTLVATAPLTMYTATFEAAARQAGWGVLLAAGMSLLLAATMIRRVTHSLEELASVTRSVAAGDFDRQVSERSASEAGQVGRAFNAMTESLRETLRQLAQRESLAAVGAFAATLAHEIRNPLTAIRIDLQRVDEQLPVESPLRGNVKRALEEVERLNHTATGALRLARSGTIASGPVDLRDPITRALAVSASTFAQRRIVLRPVALGAEAVRVSGDAVALEQLFLNLLLNAAQALGPDGEAWVTVTVGASGVRVDIADTGVGIAADQLSRVFEPFVSSKGDGTGLGLAVSQQIAAAHKGVIHIESTEGAGTTVSVQLPLASSAIS